MNPVHSSTTLTSQVFQNQKDSFEPDAPSILNAIKSKEPQLSHLDSSDSDSSSDSEEEVLAHKYRMLKEVRSPNETCCSCILS